MKKVNRIKMYVKSGLESKDIVKNIRNTFIKEGFEIVDEEYDLALSIGGDGTFLKMIHENDFDDKIYYAGINAGALGFLTNVDISDVNSLVDSLKKNKYEEIECSILKTVVETSVDTKSFLSLNELIVKKDNQSTLGSNIFINNQLFESFIGDGLLISTPSGSTGYNLSYNGPILSNINALVLTPIAPINNRIYRSIHNSLVFNGDIKISFSKNENICLLNDGKIVNIKSVIEIKSALLNRSVKFITLNGCNYIKKINKKIIGN